MNPIYTIIAILVVVALAVFFLKKINRESLEEQKRINDEIERTEAETKANELTDLLEEAAEVNTFEDAILETGVVEPELTPHKTSDQILKLLEENGVPIPLDVMESAEKTVSEEFPTAVEVKPGIGEFTSTVILTDEPLSKATPKKAKKQSVPESKKPANAKFSDADVREIRKSYETAGKDIPTLAILYSVSPRTIDRIIKRQSYVQVV